MNKPYLHRNRSIFLLALAVAGLAFLVHGETSAAGKPSPVAPQQNAQAAGRLVVERSANLGLTGIGLSIDGNKVTTINFGGRYDAPLAAGQHVLATLPVPNREHAQPSQTRVTVQPGHTYKYTARQSDVAIVLK
jgi:hypothetical protein